MSRKIILLIYIVLPAFAMAQAPVINSITPVSTYPTNKILITGSGFSTNPAQLQVWFDQVGGSIVSSTDFSIEVNVPAQARLSNVQVTNLTNGLSAKATLKFAPAYSGTDFDPAKLAAPLSFTGGTEEIFDVCSCDLDGDGKPDIAGTKQGGAAANIMIQRNTSTPGNLSFASSTLTTSSAMFNLACGDLDGDGKPELVSSRGGSARNEVFIYRNTSTVGSISFAAVAKVFLDPGQFAFRIVVRDLNQDGKPEILVSNSFNSASTFVYVFTNQSTIGTVSMNATPLKVSVTGATTTYGLDAQDLDGDKKPEIIVNQFNSSNIFIIKNTSTLAQVSFSTTQTVSAPGTLNHQVMADFNEDGKLDIASTSAFDKKAFLLLNTSSGSTISFGAPTALDTGDGPFGIDAGDIDGDGDIDMVVGNIDLDPSTPDTEVTVLRSNGNNNSLAFTTLNINVGKKSRNIKLGDLDGDGKPDIVFTTVTFNSLDVLRNTNCFTPQVLNIAPLTVCPGQTIRLNSVPGIGVTVYDWKDGATPISSGANAFLDITTAGNYNVTATSEAGACVITSASFAVTAGSGSVPTGNPPTTASSNSPACTGNPLQLNTPAVASVSYNWTGPNGFTSNVQNPVIPSASPANAGVYTLVLSNGTCNSTPVTTQVEVADLQNFSVTSSAPSNMICQGGNLTLTVNTIAGHTRQWVKDGVDIGGQTAPTLLVTQAGSYNVRVTNTLLSCSVVTNTIDVKVVTAPIASFNVKSSACTNENLSFTGTSTVDSQATPVYAWTFGDTGTSTVQNPTHAYATAQNFTAGLTVSYSGVAGCSNAASKSIAVVAAIQPTLTSSVPSSCPAEEVTLTVVGTFASITWNVPGSGQSIIVRQPGVYSVTTADANGCPGAGQVTVAAKTVPVVTATVDKSVVAPGEPAQLKASGASAYLWSPTETLNDPTLASPVASPLVTTTYTVVGTLSGGCSAQATVDVKVDSDIIAIKIPNAFSPNGDAINDLWVIAGVELYPDCMLTVFDMGGRKVFEQKGYTNTWDGTYQGKQVPEGTYFYVFGCTDKTPLSGTILVAR